MKRAVRIHTISAGDILATLQNSIVDGLVIKYHNLNPNPNINALPMPGHQLGVSLSSLDFSNINRNLHNFLVFLKSMFTCTGLYTVVYLSDRFRIVC